MKCLMTLMMHEKSQFIVTLQKILKNIRKA